MSKIKYIGASSLVNYLMGKPYVFIAGSFLTTGTEIHNNLRYTNQKMFQRRYGNYMIRGKPDKIQTYNDRIIELKTFRDPKYKDMLEKKAELQVNLYCWMSGYRTWRVDLFDIKTQQLKYGKVQPYNRERARATIRGGIRFKNALELLILQRDNNGV